MTVKDILNKLIGEKTPQIKTLNNSGTIYFLDEKKLLPISKTKSKSRKKRLLPK